MNKIVVPLLLLCACFTAQASNSTSDSAGQAPNPVVQWNQTLLVIVRTPGVQSATIHPTRSFAMMHAAIYDAVNSIDRTHSPYLVQIAHISREPPKMRRQIRQRTMSWLPSTRLSRQHWIHNSSSCWRRFLKELTRIRESALANWSPILSWMHEVRMGPQLRLRLLYSELRRVTSNPPRQIFPNRNSPGGAKSLRLLWSRQVSSGRAHRRIC